MRAGAPAGRLWDPALPGMDTGTEDPMAEGAGGGGGVMPQGEALRRALRWLDERAREEKAPARLKLVGEAATRFDLSPPEEEFLLTNWVRPK